MRLSLAELKLNQVNERIESGELCFGPDACTGY